EGGARIVAQTNRRALGGGPQEILAARRVRGVRPDRSADRHAGATRGTRGGVRLGGVLPLLLPVSGRGRGARQPAAVPALALDVAPEHRARTVGTRPDAARLRDPSGSVAPQGRARLVKIHDRYLLREFLTYLSLGLAGFI